MQEIKGDLFSHSEAGPDAICLATNGFVNSAGANVMGRGCAGEAKRRWPGIESVLGALLIEGENHVHVLTTDVDVFKLDKGVECTPGQVLVTSPWVDRDHDLPYHIVSFPTKLDTAAYFDLLPGYQTPKRAEEGANGGVFPGWMAASNLALIEQSTKELVTIADERGWRNIVLPRPGCGAGELSWDEVRPILSDLLDERFYTITFK